MNKIINNECLNVLETLNDESVDLIITDPPYGIAYKSNRQDYFDMIKNDDKLDFRWINECFRVLKNNSAIYICVHWSKWSVFYDAVISVGFEIKNMIVFNKSNHGMGDLTGQFAPKHELLLFAVKGRHTFYQARRIPDIWDVSVICSRSHHKHPNEKPVKWFFNPIKYSSKKGDLVLYPFCGSGSTCAAAEYLGRNYLGIEMYEPYFKEAVNRLKNRDIFGDMNDQ